MAVLVTGSVAFDTIMVMQESFRERILPDKIHILNVAFVVPDLEKRWGGTAGNIAYNVRRLDIEPLLLATAGRDFGPYAEWLDECGVRRDWIRILEDTFTAQAFITTDLEDNQITAFHPGAMDRAHEATLDSVDESYSAGIVGPNGKQAMIEHAKGLKERGIPCIVDPGQGLPLFDGPALLELMEGATVYVVNDYEWELTLQRTGEGESALLERVGAVIVTLGEKGSRLVRGGLDGASLLSEARIEVPALKPARVVDPTGCGDSYRSGLLYAFEKGLSLDAGARLGSVMGSLKIENSGPQSIEKSKAEIAALYEREFGAALG